ncbi:MAG: Smr/MutS family protein [Myxococcota bacterium]
MSIEAPPDETASKPLPASVRPKKRAPPTPAPVPPDQPLDGYSYEDRAAFQQEFGQVRPLGSKKSQTRAPKRVSPTPATPASSDPSARQRLDALVSGGILFQVEVDSDGFVVGERQGANPKHLATLKHGRATPEAELDLHGRRADEAVSTVVQFLRNARRKRHRVVRVIVGKGNRSPAGGVLRNAICDAIADGPAAAFVFAFCSADRRYGGTGALLIRVAD